MPGIHGPMRTNLHAHDCLKMAKKFLKEWEESDKLDAYFIVQCAFVLRFGIEAHFLGRYIALTNDREGIESKYRPGDVKAMMEKIDEGALENQSVTVLLVDRITGTVKNATEMNYTILPAQKAFGYWGDLSKLLHANILVAASGWDREFWLEKEALVRSVIDDFELAISGSLGSRVSFN